MVACRFIIFSLFAFVAIPSLAAVDLQDMRFSELPNNRFEMRATFSGVPQLPQGYAIEKPARIVLDLPGVESQLPQKKYSLDFGYAKSAVVLTAKERTRIILNLSAPASYSSTVEGNTLITIIESASTVAKTFTRTQATQQKPSSTPSTLAGEAQNTITDIDFQRGEDGAGKLLLALSDSKVLVDVEESAGRIVINFSDATVPEALRRRLDVVDFATPVKMIETNTSGNDVKISIDAQGEYDYLAYQADGVYVVSVKPLTEEEAEEKKARFAYVGEKLSLNFQDIEVRKVLEIIADFTDLNLVASDTVQGNITLRLQNVPWDQALELVLKSKGLDKRQAGNVLLVAPAAEIAERERQELQSRKQLQALEPLQTDFIHVRYAKAADILKLLTSNSSAPTSTDGSDSGTDVGAQKNVLSLRGSAVVDDRTNAIIITDTVSSIAGVKQLVEQVDIPVRQVMIEARIVIADTNFTKELGTRFGGFSSSTINGNSNSVVDTAGSIDAFEDGGPEGFFNGTQQIDLNDSQFVDLPISNPVGSFALSFINDGVFLDLELSALESSGYVEVVSQPKVITADKQQAKIESGQEVPFTSSDGDTVTTIFRDAVLSLEVTPQITPDNRVIMDLKVNQDSIGEQTSEGPAINVTQLETNVLVGDGETVVLGGIFQETRRDGVTKIPLLGDIPFLGRIFRSTEKVDNKEELLIFITPRILADTIIER